MKRKGVLVGALVAALLIATVVSGAFAATRDEIEQAVDNGVAWLAGRQNPDGSWGGWEQAADTCFVLVKLEERAYDLDYDSPFNPEYPYSNNVIRGWQYIFGTPHIHQWMGLGVQYHAGNPDDPDSNGNGYGIYFDTWGSHRTYTTGICLMALAASGTPDRANDAGLDFNGNGSADTFAELAQEAVDWLAFAQGDFGVNPPQWPEGGWTYQELDNAGWGADNSNSGYAVLGLAYGESFGAVVPAWVRSELNVWIGSIQCNASGSDFGGSGYTWGCDGWVNQLKTGNLIFEMTFYGDDPSVQRFDDALDYIARHWLDQNTDPGWGYNQYPASYQAMYTLMKGFEYSGIELIDLDGDGTPEHDWFDEFSTVLVSQQNPDGSWPGCYWGDDILCTTWALLTLEKAAPPSPFCTNVLDDFDRWPDPHGYAKLGPNWRGATTLGNYRIIANQVQVLAGGAIYWQPETYDPDQQACVTLTNIDSQGHHGVLLKIQGDPANWKQGVIGVSYSNYEPPKNKIKVETYVPGKGWTTLALFEVSVQNGDQLGGRALPDGTVEVYVNKVKIGEVDAGPFFVDKGGSIGLWFMSPGYPHAALDDFAGR